LRIKALTFWRIKLTCGCKNKKSWKWWLFSHTTFFWRAWQTDLKK